MHVVRLLLLKEETRRMACFFYFRWNQHGAEREAGNYLGRLINQQTLETRLENHGSSLHSSLYP